MSDPRIAKLAHVLVNYSSRVEPGQLVRIASPCLALPLVSALTREVLLAGGHPMVRLTYDEYDEIVLAHATEDQLRYVSPVAVDEVERVDAHISVWADENTKNLSRADPRRLAIVQAARKPIFNRFMARAAEGKLRWVGTQFPTHAHAQDAEMSLTDYSDFVFRAGLLDHPDPIAAWRKVSETQQRLVDHLAGKTDYRVVAANGTDVRMSLAGRTWVNCDGHENFPDGEVFTGPVESSVNGTIAFSFPAVHLGREVDDVRLTFRDGRVVDARAGKGEAFLHQMLDMDAGSRLLGECAIGTNFGIADYTRNTLFDEKIGGTVHFALGAGYPETGNANESGLHWDMVRRPPQRRPRRGRRRADQRRRPVRPRGLSRSVTRRAGLAAEARSTQRKTQRRSSVKRTCSLRMLRDLCDSAANVPHRGLARPRPGRGPTSTDDRHLAQLSTYPCVTFDAKTSRKIRVWREVGSSGKSPASAQGRPRPARPAARPRSAPRVDRPSPASVVQEVTKAHASARTALYRRARACRPWPPNPAQRGVGRRRNPDESTTNQLEAAGVAAWCLEVIF